MDDVQDVHRVLVLYTGGTIGMKQMDGEDKYELDLTPLQEQIRKCPLLHDIKATVSEANRINHGNSTDQFVLPSFKQSPRIVYEIKSCGEIKESSNAGIQDWVNIAMAIERCYYDYAGFVVLHGTDSLSYAASALSFMLENLNKTVVITGAHTPMYKVLNDAVDNLLWALLIAGQFVIPEVTVYFGHKLLRANRSVKLHAQHFNCFDSPAFPVLANVNNDIKLQHDLILPPPLSGQFQVHTNMNPNLAVIHLFPGISINMVRGCLEPPTEGVVLQAYGTGAIPKRLLPDMRRAADRGVIIVVCTQCIDGPAAVDADIIQQTISSAGMVSGMDMTTEAALAKLSYVLGKHHLDTQQRKKLMATCLRGEMAMSSINGQPNTSDRKLMEHALGLSSAVASGDMDAVRQICQQVGLLASTHASATAEQASPSVSSDMTRLRVSIVDVRGNGQVGDTRAGTKRGVGTKGIQDEEASSKKKAKVLTYEDTRKKERNSLGQCIVNDATQRHDSERNSLGQCIVNEATQRHDSERNSLGQCIVNQEGEIKTESVQGQDANETTLEGNEDETKEEKKMKRRKVRRKREKKKKKKGKTGKTNSCYY